MKKLYISEIKLIEMNKFRSISITLKLNEKSKYFLNIIVNKNKANGV